MIRNRQTASLKADGVRVIHVRAGGPVVTVVSGQRTQREEDEFFVVPAGTTVSIETGNDTVVLTVHSKCSGKELRRLEVRPSHKS